MNNRNQYGTYCVIGVIAAAVCLFVIKFDRIVSGVSFVFTAAAPLFMGCVIAYILNILLKRVEAVWFPKTKNEKLLAAKRPVCIVLSFLILFLILIFIVYLVVPELISSIRLVTAEIPEALEGLRLWAIDHSDRIPSIQAGLENADIDWQKMTKKTLDLLAAGAGGLVSSVVSVFARVFGTAAKLLIGTIFAIYLLSAKETLCAQADRWIRAFLPPETGRKIRYVVGTLHETFTSFIVGQCVEAVIIGSLCAAGMLILRLPYAVMTGAVVGVTALIPVVGAYIGAVIGAFMVFTVNPLQAVLFVVFLVILQQAEGNLIYPKVVGSSIGLPGLWVLAAVTVGGGVFGVAGMLLGVPLAAAFYKLMGEAVERRLAKRRNEKKQKG